VTPELKKLIKFRFQIELLLKFERGTSPVPKNTENITIIFKSYNLAQEVESTCRSKYKLYIRNPGVESYDWYIYGSNRRGGPGGSRFFGPPLQNLLGHSYEILNISSGSSAQARLIGTLFEKIGLNGHVQKSEAHALGCRQRGESRQ